MTAMRVGIEYLAGYHGWQCAEKGTTVRSGCSLGLVSSKGKLGGKREKRRGRSEDVTKQTDSSFRSQSVPVCWKEELGSWSEGTGGWDSGMAAGREQG